MKNILALKELIKIQLGEGCAAIIQNPKNRRYLSGFSSTDGILIVSDKSYLILDFRYAESAQIKQAQGQIPSQLEIVQPEKGFWGAVGEILKREGKNKLFFEDNYVTCREYEDIKKRLEGVELLPMNGAVEKLRRIKSESELKKIKASQEITDSAFEYILKFIRPGRTEAEVAAELDYFMRKNGAYPAFDTICVSGRKSSLPHGVPEDIPLTQNGFLTMDFGACLDGYCSDMTRTVVLGKADDKMKRVYQTVLDAQNAVFAVIKGGITGKDADAAARDLIYSQGYEGCFGHSLGHSIGLDIHEAPNFSPSNPQPVPAGCVLSVEPGVYLEGLYGVRTEDMVFLTPDGYQNLTHSPKQLIEL